jgi:hypothetical protein
MAENRTVSIVRSFKGLYDTKRMPFNDTGRTIFVSPIWTKELVIRDEESFHRFVDEIPTKVMDCVPDPPPSTDPLLSRPPIDFQSHMLLVIIAEAAARLVVDLEIERLELTSRSMKVYWRCGEPVLGPNKILGYGNYHAVVVNRFDGDVEFTRTTAVD